MSFDGIKDIIEGINVGGEGAEAFNSRLGKFSGGNNVCFVHDNQFPPAPDKMEKQTIYFAARGDEIYAFGSKTDRNKPLEPLKLDESTKKEIIELIKTHKPISHLAKNLPEQEEEKERRLKKIEDIERNLFKAAKSHYSVTYKQGFLDGIDAVNNGVSKLSQAMDRNPIGRGIKRAAIEVGGMTTLAFNTGVSIAFGNKKALTYNPNKTRSYIRYAANAAVEKFKAGWEKMENSKYSVLSVPTKALSKTADAIHTVTNSKFASQAVSVGLGVSAALAMGAGIAFSAPVSIPIIAASSVAVVAVGAAADKRRHDIANEKRYLEDLVVGAHQKQQSLARLKERGIEIPNVSNLKVKEPVLNNVSTSTVAHTRPLKKLAQVFAFNAASIAVNAVSGDLAGMAMKGSALAAGSVGSVASEISDKNAKRMVQNQIEHLKEMLPEAVNKDDKYQIRNIAKKEMLEASVLSRIEDEVAKNKLPASKVNGDLFQEYYKQAEEKLNKGEFTKPRDLSAGTSTKEGQQENIMLKNRYNEEKLEKATGLKAFYQGAKNAVKHVSNYLFNEAATYKESAGVSDELKVVFKIQDNKHDKIVAAVQQTKQVHKELMSELTKSRTINASAIEQKLKSRESEVVSYSTYASNPNKRNQVITH